MFGQKMRLRSTIHIVVGAFVLTALLQSGFWMLRYGPAVETARRWSDHDRVSARELDAGPRDAASFRELGPDRDRSNEIEEREPGSENDPGPGPDPEDDPGVPTPPPDQIWRLNFRAFPDTVGIGGYVCPGCDGVLSDADKMGAISGRLNPLTVEVIQPGNPENVYWLGRLDRSLVSQADVRASILLAVPPPYEIRLISRNPLGYELCPNSPDTIFLTQDDFDAAAGGAPGTGRNLAQSWYFWRCMPDD